MRVKQKAEYLTRSIDKSSRSKITVAEHHIKTNEQWLGRRREKQVIMHSESILLPDEVHKDDFIWRTA